MIKKIIFPLFFFSFFCHCAFAKEIVSDFKIQGNQRLENNTIISYLPFKKGDEVELQKIDDALKVLYKT